MGTGADDKGATLEELDAAAREAEERVTGALNVGAALAMMRARHSGERGPVPLCLVDGPGPLTPWDAAEELLGGGLWPGLWMLVGPTGTGKTQLALSLALGAALKGCPVAYVGLELDEVGIVARLVGLRSRTPWSGLYLGSTELTGAALRAAKELEGLPIVAEYGSPMGWPPDKLAEVAARLAKLAKARGIDTKRRPPLVVLDFLQLVGDTTEAAASGRTMQVRERIQFAAYQARAVAREHGVAVLAVSSTSRDNVGRLWLGAAEELPMPSALVGTGKESGEIEYSADGVLVLVGHQGDGYGERQVSVAVAKQRAGRTGWLHLAFNGHRHRPSTGEELASRQTAEAEAKEAAKPAKRGAAKGQPRRPLAPGEVPE